MEKFQAVKDLVASIEADADKFYNKANSAAGTRVRKGMQELKNLAQEIRLEIQNSKNQETAGASASTEKKSAPKAASSKGSSKGTSKK